VGRFSSLGPAARTSLSEFYERRMQAWKQAGRISRIWDSGGTDGARGYIYVGRDTAIPTYCKTDHL
jgi:hypothetical protein